MTTVSNLISTYIAYGLDASKPGTPSVGTGDASYFYATDTTTLYCWTGVSWTAITGGGGGGGYPPGTVPTVVQHAFNVNGTNSVTFGAGPTNGNYLVAMTFNPASNTAGSGWTSQVSVSSGTDFGTILTKTAGVAESTTQSPLTGVAGTGCMVVWEINGQNVSTPFVSGNSQTESSGITNVPILFPGCMNCLGLSAVSALSVFTGTFNEGTQDVLNTGGARDLVAGHTDLSTTPMVGILTTFATTASAKGATCLISS